MNRRIARILVGAFLALFFALSFFAVNRSQGDDAPSKQPTAPKSEERTQARIWYQLVKIDIPPDSPHRKNDDFSHPPRLYVIFKKNGEKIGPRSKSQEGWAAIFEPDVDNEWPVREGTDDLYTIEVWDLNWVRSSKMIFNMAGLKGEAFRKTMYEVGGELDEKNRLASIEWKQIETPEKYR